VRYKALNVVFGNVELEIVGNNAFMAVLKYYFLLSGGDELNREPSLSG
jgi:hypothetical protein